MLGPELRGYVDEPSIRTFPPPVIDDANVEPQKGEINAVRYDRKSKMKSSRVVDRQDMRGLFDQIAEND